MKVTNTKTTKISTQLVIQADQKDMEATKLKTIDRLAQNLQLPGFRVGKVPASLAAKKLDQAQLSQAFLNDFVPKVVIKALEKKQLNPYLNPEINVTKFVPFTELEIEVLIEYIGEIKLADYKKLKLAKPQVKAEAKEVDAVVDRLRHDKAQYNQVDRKSQLGDRLLLDFQGYDTKKADETIPGTVAQDYHLILGSQALIPGFEPKLVGFHAGQETEFEITFPKNYQVKSLAGKLVVFKCSIKKVEEVILPELGDNLVADLSQFEDLADFKKQLKQQILADKKEQAELILEGQAVAKLAQASSMEIPQKMLDVEIGKLTAQHESFLKSNQIDHKTWLKYNQLDEAKHLENLKKEAAARIKGGVVLKEIAETEKITVSDEEVKREVLKFQMANRQDKVDDRSLERDARAKLLTRKTLDYLRKSVLKV